jgi:hemerythrin-like metal-binding protein
MDTGLIEWDDRYLVGIELIDEQHRELVSQVNNLCLGCKKGDTAAKQFFDLNIHPLMRYLRYHFSSEEKMLERIRYPDLAAHGKQHSSLLRIVAEGVRVGYEDTSLVYSGNKLRDFVAHLRDMLISHIAVLDRKYVSYIHFVNRKTGTYHMVEATPPTELFIG